MHRIVSIVLVLITLVISCISLEIFKTEEKYELEIPINCTYRINDESIVDIDESDNKLILTTKNTGNTSLFIIDEDGNEIEYVIDVYGTDIFVSKVN